jgi:beta-phosphoglucomutase-like phosphatase (HAD superfamily)
MTPECIIFAGLGTLVECAELDRAAWNAAFRMYALDWHWTKDIYADLLRRGTDRNLATRYGKTMAPPVDAVALDHAHQTIFAAKLAGGIPLRPSVAGVMHWAARAGIGLGLVSRSQANPVSALLSATARERGGIVFDAAILREDMAHLPPHPDGFQRALAALKPGVGHGVVIADTPVVARAAQAAGLPVVVFPGEVGRGAIDDFDARLASVDHLTNEALTTICRAALHEAAQ